MPLPTVAIHYLRPPDREQVFRQVLLYDGEDVKVTLASGLAFDPPLVIAGDLALETGSDAVWLTFPGAWHDVGRFHDRRGRFTGLYANVLTPPTFHPGHVWRTTDLFLDVWVPPGGEPRLLDREELEAAARRGWIDAPTRRRALEEGERLLAAFREGRWPPPVVEAWTLERAREVAAGGG